MKIYTKTGDDGTTGTLGAGRVKKSDLVMEVLGSLDELNACLGFLGDGELVMDVQSALFDIGAEVAADEGDERFIAGGLVELVGNLEQDIDRMTEKLPELKAFVLPGGVVEACHAHHARTVCRRAERRMIELVEIKSVRQDLLVFVNRLSDWLFTLARMKNMEAGRAERIWRKR